MTDKVAICNLALDKLGASRVSSIDAPISTTERRLSLLYGQSRDVELRKRRWLFATHSVQLQRSTPDIDNYERPYRYLRPVDFLRLIRVQGENLEVRGSSVLSDTDGIVFMRYVRRVPESEFDPLFVDVLACRIAAEIAEAVTQSNEKKDTARADYRMAVREAGQANAFERGPEELHADDNTFDWLTGRYGFG